MEKINRVTIIGSLTCREEMEKAKDYYMGLGCDVESPLDYQGEGLPLLTIQKMWIKFIKEADFIVAIPKNKHFVGESGVTKYIIEFGESTSYEMAIAREFGKEIRIW